MSRKNPEEMLKKRRKWSFMAPAFGFGSLLLAAALLFIPSKADAAPGRLEDGSSVCINLSPDLYQALFGKTETDSMLDTDVAVTSDITKDDLFFEEGGQLFVVYKGRRMQVVDTDEGLHVLQEDGTEEPIEDAVLDVDAPQIMTDTEGNRYYHIVWGDTLCKISSDVHYSVNELAEYNHIRNVHLIYAESDLRIPD